MGKKLTFSIASLLICSNILFAESYKIGVLAKRNIERCLDKWGNTALYLNDQIDDNVFTIIPLSFGEVESAVRNKRVDFILTNPAVYVNLESKYDINRIATLINKNDEHISTSRFAGAIFCLKGRTDINDLTDLKNKNIAAVEINSFGGWLAAKREIAKAEIDAPKDFKSLTYTGSHDDVVFAVMDKNADIGIVRSDSLERLSHEGKIKLDNIKIINPISDDTIPFLHSTSSYPEWPFSALNHIPEELAKQVAVALLEMPADSPAAISANCTGWTVPSNYQPVHECLKELNYTPYESYGKITLSKVIERYKYLLINTVIFIALIVAMAIRVYGINLKLKLATKKQKEEIAARLKIQMELEKASKAKEQFLANMSHEIRTPMNAIIGFCDLLKEFNLPKEAKIYIEKISISGNSLLRLINDILDFSKIEAGKMDVEISEFSLAKILNNIESIIHTKVIEKQLDFGIIENGKLPATIKSDPYRLTQCMINLCNNAVKFTNSGHVHIVISTFKKDKKDFISFAVEDTGIGIMKEKLESIFEPFSQADGTISRKYGGTGLGLSITKRLTNLIGGELECNSEPGLGTTFTITIPAGVEVDTVKTMDRLNLNEISRSEKDKLPTHFIGKILVAEDSPTNQMLIKIYLEKMGLEVDIAENGQFALDMAIKGNYKIVFMDMQMPEMDGCEATERLRKAGYDRPIIALTANAMKGDKEKCIDAGCDDYLSKPIDRAKLIAALEQYLGEISSGEATDENNETCNLPISKAALMRNCGSPELVEKLVEVFIEDSNFCIEKIDEAIKTSNSPQVFLYAHRLKGSARHTASVRLAELALELEIAGKEEQIDTFAALFEKLHAEYDRVLKYILSKGWKDS